MSLDMVKCPLYMRGGIGCDDCVLEAWERMTTGGLKVPCLPGYPYAHAVETPHRVLVMGRASYVEWS